MNTPTDEEYDFFGEEDFEFGDSDSGFEEPDSQEGSEPDQSPIAEGLDDDFEVNPLAILEGMLFVGHPDNHPFTAREMAALMRGVEEDEIDELVAQLNQSYRQSNSPFEIVSDHDGYRLVLGSQYEYCRQRFYREEKAAKLSQPVIDVLSLVAYLQPVTRKTIDEKRQKGSGSILNQLVRRRLVEIERVKTDGKAETVYRTTGRFLDLFQIDSLDELPKSQTFEVD